MGRTPWHTERIADRSSLISLDVVGVRGGLESSHLCGSTGLEVHRICLFYSSVCITYTTLLSSDANEGVPFMQFMRVLHVQNVRLLREGEVGEVVASESYTLAVLQRGRVTKLQIVQKAVWCICVWPWHWSTTTNVSRRAMSGIPRTANCGIHNPFATMQSGGS